MILVCRDTADGYIGSYSYFYYSQKNEGLTGLTKISIDFFFSFFLERDRKEKFFQMQYATKESFGKSIRMLLFT